MNHLCDAIGFIILFGFVMLVWAYLKRESRIMAENRQMEIKHQAVVDAEICRRREEQQARMNGYRFAAQKEGEKRRDDEQARAIEIRKPIVSGDDLEAIESELRDMARSGMVGNEFVAVKWMCSPTGRFAIKWVMNSSDPEQELTITRNRQDFVKDGSLANEVGGQLEIGKSYLFHVAYRCGYAERSDFVFEIKVPTREEWLRSIEGCTRLIPITPPKAVKPQDVGHRFKSVLNQMKSLRKVQVEMHRWVKSLKLPKAEERLWLADIDAMIAQERGGNE